LTTLSTLLVKLGIDKTDYDKGLDDAEKKTGASLKAIGDKMSSVGKTMSLYVTAPIVGGFALSIKAASDMNETLSKSNVVFGDSAKAVEQFTSSAATNLGMTQQSALEAAGTFGNLFVSMGMGQAPAADMSTDLLQLAADLASFNNLNPTEVLEKLRSGLVGETEPLRSLGVNISETAMKAQALAMGLGDASGNLTEAEKVTARYALIMQQTTTAQGDFARTSDGLANSSRILKAELGDAAATLGAQLLPIVTQVVQTVTGWLASFRELSPEAQKIIVVVLAIVAVIGPLLMIIGALIPALGAIGTVVGTVAGILTFPLIAIIAAVIAVVALLYEAWTNNWGGIQEKTQAVLAFISSLISSVLAGIRKFWADHGAQIMAIAKTAWDTIQKGVGAVLAFISILINTVLATIRGFWDAHGAQIIAIAKAAWDAIQKGIQAVTVIIKAIVDAFQAAFRGDWTAFGEAIRTAWDAAWNLIIGVVNTAWATIIAAVSAAWTGLKAALATLVKNAITLITTTNWGEVGTNIVKGIATGITSAIQWVIKAISGMASAVIAAIRGFLGIKSPSKVFEQLGILSGQGFALGLMKATGTVRIAGAGMAGSPLGGAMGGGDYSRVTNINVSPHYYRGSEPSLMDELAAIGAFSRA
jgi:phage-related protein